MKKLIIMLAFAVSTSAMAQSTMKEDVDIIQAAYGKSKKELVIQYMTLDSAQTAPFWAMYDEYEKERKLLGQQRIQLINDYAKNFATLDDAKADQLAKAALKNGADYEKLLGKYYEKCKKITGGLNAAKFIQLESYLQTAVRSEIQNAIPFICEIDRTKPHHH